MLFRLYKQLFESEYGPGYGEGMLEKLKEEIKKLNEGFGDECIAFKQISSEEFAVAVCTPCMKRTHKLWQSSGEMVFVDSSGTMDRLGLRVFILLTHSPLGGLALGVFYVTSETEEVIEAAVQLYLTLLPPGAFGGRGLLGPLLFLTDDCAALG